MVAVLIFVIFMLIVAIVYLNLLVAMMTSGYTEVGGRREERNFQAISRKLHHLAFVYLKKLLVALTTSGYTEGGRGRRAKFPGNFQEVLRSGKSRSTASVVVTSDLWLPSMLARCFRRPGCCFLAFRIVFPEISARSISCRSSFGLDRLFGELQ